jgi:hypothetical protein
MLKRLAAVAVAVGAGLAPSATGELDGIPEDLLESLLEPEELSRIEPQDREALVSLLAMDRRPAVRARAAVSLTFLSPELTFGLERLLERLAGDPSASVRRVLGGMLGPLIARMPALDRSCLVCEWAASPEERRRQAIVAALAWPFDAVGAQTALTSLLDDVSPHVRSASLRADQRRRHSNV